MIYPTPSWLLAFSAGKGVHGTEPGIDARQTGLSGESLQIPATSIMIPRQTHSTNVCWVDTFGEVPDTDAVITDKPGLCIAVKTADCIPVLLFDQRQHRIAAIHAGWRGTVGRIVEKTLLQLQSRAEDISAIIGPGISLESFEVGDEVYEQFLQAGFPMQRLAKRYAKWHINLKDANRWLLESNGITNIQVSDIDTLTTPDYYSARRDTINTGRNINGIMIIS
ncbi:MAG: peptidoglycan editing factor PgeF [Bacteroidaceae bacterium]|nr:peptidoglycan editing factor PgeF [Bacteroidaceae bacterium]MBR1902388.1 peptidoglycan editing factor PgeF [Bacteroidaceae bacterium]